MITKHSRQKTQKLGLRLVYDKRFRVRFPLRYLFISKECPSISKSFFTRNRYCVLCRRSDRKLFDLRRSGVSLSIRTNSWKISPSFHADKCMDILNSRMIIYDLIDLSSLQSTDKRKSCNLILHHRIYR
jgi:hypothetical protein